MTTLLSNPKIHPELAFTHCGLFLDPESAYLQSKQWWEENEKVAEEQEPTNNPVTPDATENTTVEEEVEEQ